jgi:hypothetical protein
MPQQKQQHEREKKQLPNKENLTIPGSQHTPRAQAQFNSYPVISNIQPDSWLAIFSHKYDSA